ncbi:MAG: hypothetical protein HKO80_11170 [Flavobacteriaceae bacterium]|nr:hypothetical protein [Flavobacteriaceae bacterium]
MKTKKITLILCLLFLGLGSTVFAQKIKIKGNTILVDKQPFALIESEGFVVKNHTISTLDGNVIVFAKFNQYPEDYTANSGGYYEVKFMDSELVTEMENASLKSFAKVLVKKMIDTKMVNGNVLNIENIAVFYKKYHEDIAQKLDRHKEILANADAQVGIEKGRVLRDVEAEIEVMNRELFQDKKRIGYFRQSSLSDYQFFTVAGKQVAKVNIKSDLKSTTSINTFLDGKIHTIELGYGRSKDHQKKITEFLVVNNYL